MEEKQSYIYSLEYPEGNVKYIGKANDLKKRLKGHLDKINQHVSHKNSWIKGLLSKGVKPIINVVDVIPEKEWQFWEEHYIWLYRSYGFKLTNLTFGGDGMSNPSPETIEKIRKSTLANYANGFQVWNKGTKGIMGEWNKGVVRTEEQKRKISETKKAQYASGEKVVWNKGKKTGHTPWNKGLNASNNPNSKKLNQIDPTTNEVLKMYDSCIQAVRETGYKYISYACRAGRVYEGFKWEYLND